jgi:hypothetical protein
MIIAPELWQKVKELLAANNQGQRQPGTRTSGSVLSGLVFDAEGNRYTATHAVKKGRRYRYYTSQAAIQKRKRPSYLDRVPAKELEQLVSSRLHAMLASPQEMCTACAESPLLANEIGRLVEAAQELAARWSNLTFEESAELLRHIVRRIVVCPSETEIEVDIEALAARWLAADSRVLCSEGRASHPGERLLKLKCSFALARRRGELRLVVPGSDIGVAGKPNSSLFKALATAHHWRERIIAGEIYSREQLATEAKVTRSYAGRILRLAALSPDIVDGIVRDRLVVRSLKQLITGLPLEWKNQQSWLRLA